MADRKVEIYMRSGGIGFRQVWPKRSDDIVQVNPVASCTWEHENPGKPKLSQHLLKIGGETYIIPIQEGPFKPGDYAAIAAKALDVSPSNESPDETSILIIEAF
jgi:hypothetical protein